MALLFMHLLHKIINRRADDAGLDQEQSDLGLHCLLMTFCPEVSVWNFRTTTIHFFFFFVLFALK